jgi:ribosomal protein S18 acetylase RimI-like enzyme
MFIRKANIQDANELYRIHSQCFASGELWDVNSFMRRISDVSVICNDQGIVGLLAQGRVSTLGMRCLSDLYFGMIEFGIITVCVHPDFRRMGYSEELLKHHLESNPDKTSTLTVRCSNEAAIKLYEKYNYVSVGVRENYYSNPIESGFLMKRYLD